MSFSRDFLAGLAAGAEVSQRWAIQRYYEDEARRKAEDEARQAATVAEQAQLLGLPAPSRQTGATPQSNDLISRISRWLSGDSTQSAPAPAAAPAPASAPAPAPAQPAQPTPAPAAAPTSAPAPAGGAISLSAREARPPNNAPSFVAAMAGSGTRLPELRRRGEQIPQEHVTSLVTEIARSAPDGQVTRTSWDNWLRRGYLNVLNAHGVAQALNWLQTMETVRQVGLSRAAALGLQALEAGDVQGVKRAIAGGDLFFPDGVKRDIELVAPNRWRVTETPERTPGTPPPSPTVREITTEQLKTGLMTLINPLETQRLLQQAERDRFDRAMRLREVTRREQMDTEFARTVPEILELDKLQSQIVSSNDRSEVARLLDQYEAKRTQLIEKVRNSGNPRLADIMVKLYSARSREELARDREALRLQQRDYKNAADALNKILDDLNNATIVGGQQPLLPDEALAVRGMFQSLWAYNNTGAAPTPGEVVAPYAIFLARLGRTEQPVETDGRRTWVTRPVLVDEPAREGAVRIKLVRIENNNPSAPITDREGRLSPNVRIADLGLPSIEIPQSMVGPLRLAPPTAGGQQDSAAPTRSRTRPQAQTPETPSPQPQAPISDSLSAPRSRTSEMNRVYAALRDSMPSPEARLAFLETALSSPSGRETLLTLIAQARGTAVDKVDDADSRLEALVRQLRLATRSEMQRR